MMLRSFRSQLPSTLSRFLQQACIPASQEGLECSTISLQQQHHSRHFSAPVPKLNDTPMPPELQQELAKLNEQLHKASRLDGRQRLDFSSADLPFPIPKHEVEAGLLTIDVHVRAVEGSNACKWLRKAGRTPIRVQSAAPGNQHLKLHMRSGDALKLVKMYGRQGCQARVVALRVVHPEDESKALALIRVKPQKVHMKSTKEIVENIDFLFCPKDRIVNVDVPIRLLHDDTAPGVKKGAWMHIVKRTVRYQALGSHIPPFIEVDVGHLDMGQSFKVRHLPIPPHTRLPEQDYNAAVIRCTTDVGKD